MSILATQQQTAVLPPSRLVAGVLQRKCSCGNHTMGGGGCAECRKKETLQRSATSNNAINNVPSIVHDVLRSSGQPLDAAARAFMEPRFGHDFSSVRIHSDSQAAESARAVNALAYTVGQNVVFGRGQYAPDTAGGRRLLAHELTHVTQQASQGTANLQTLSEIGPADDQYERDADRVADEVVSHAEPGKVRAASVSSGTRLQRQVPGPLGELEPRCLVDWQAVWERRFNLAEHLECCANLPVIGEGCSSQAVNAIRNILGGGGGGGGTTPPSPCPGREIPITGTCCPPNQHWNGERCVPFTLPPPEICRPGETPNLFGGCCRPGQFFDRMGRPCLVQTPVQPPVQPPVTPPTPTPSLPSLPQATQIFFNRDKPGPGDSIAQSLTSPGRTNFNNLVTQLTANPTLRVQLVGRASPEGTEDYNYELGTRRANLIAQALISAGISASRIDDPPTNELRSECRLITRGVVSCGEAGSSGDTDRQVLARVFAPTNTP